MQEKKLHQAAAIALRTWKKNGHALDDKNPLHINAYLLLKAQNPSGQVRLPAMLAALEAAKVRQETSAMMSTEFWVAPRHSLPAKLPQQHAHYVVEQDEIERNFVCPLGFDFDMWVIFDINTPKTKLPWRCKRMLFQNRTGTTITAPRAAAAGSLGVLPGVVLLDGSSTASSLEAPSRAGNSNAGDDDPLGASVPSGGAGQASQPKRAALPSVPAKAEAPAAPSAATAVKREGCANRPLVVHLSEECSEATEQHNLDVILDGMWTAKAAGKIYCANLGDSSTVYFWALQVVDSLPKLEAPQAAMDAEPEAAMGARPDPHKQVKDTFGSHLVKVDRGGKLVLHDWNS